jgi:hypothetical protein
MDLPYAEDIAERLRTLLPPQIQQTLNQDKELPPEVMQAMQQAEAAMQQVQQQGQLVQAAAAELEQEKSLNSKDKAEIKVELANVRAAKAEFDAHVAQEMSRLIQTKAGIATDGANLTLKAAEGKEQEIQTRVEPKYNELVGLTEKALNVDSLDNVLSQFMQVVDSAMRNLEKKADRQVVSGKTRREGGKLIAEVKYDDGTEKSIAAVRDKGNLRIVPDNQRSEL